MEKKSVGIVMMTYFSGRSFKASQMPEIIHRLSKDRQLGESYGLPYHLDSSEYSIEELKYLKRSMFCRILIGILSNINKRVVKIPFIYQKYEIIYGLFAKMHYNKKNVPDIVLMKPRPAFLVEYMKKLGAYVIVEASENHTRFTYEQIKEEAERMQVQIKFNNYVDERAISNYEQGINLANGLICLSEFSKQTYVDRGFSADKIRKVPLNLKEKISKPNKIDDELYFITVANHSILKGTHRLVKVWKDYNIKSKLIVVGPVDEELKEVIARFEFVENVEYWGYKSYDYMKEFYSTHRCVGVLLSFSESFGRSIYECMCTSTPVIVTKYCTLDMVTDLVNGCVVNPEKEEEIFSAIKMFETLSSDAFFRYQCNVYQTMQEHKIDFGTEYMQAINELANG